MKWLMAIPVWSTPRDSLNRFNLVFSRCPYEESPFRVSFSCWYARLDSNQRPTESELSGRQAGKPCRARAWLRLHKFPVIYEKTSEPLWRKGSGGFRDSSQIVVWIKCGFSSPVQLNIFTLYPWIRSAASHPSTLARSSTIPACAFASSYCFCS